MNMSALSLVGPVLSKVHRSVSEASEHMDGSSFSIIWFNDDEI